MRTTMMKGKVFGKLTVTGGKDSGSKNTYWECTCGCGTKRMFRSDRLHSGKSRSCGCSKRDEYVDRSVIPATVVKHIPNASEIIKPRTLPVNFFDRSVATHGMTDSAEFITWCSMKERCYNPNSSNFKHYGGRGIIICEEWLDDFVSFYSYVGDKPTEGHSIDRFPDNNGNYEPGNVRWATHEQQSNNRRCCKPILYNGKTLTASQWSRIVGLPDGVIRTRIFDLKWDIARAMTQPVRKYVTLS